MPNEIGVLCARSSQFNEQMNFVNEFLEDDVANVFLCCFCLDAEQPVENSNFKITLSNWSWIVRNEFVDHEVISCCQC